MSGPDAERSPENMTPSERYAASRRRAREERGELGAFARDMPFPLDDFQRRACAVLEGGKSVMVSAPTGAGKTVVADFAVRLARREGRKIFYTTPIKALSNQKFSELADRYGTDNVGLLTGDVSVRGDADIVVMTTEVLRNMLYAGSSTLDGLGYVLLDEVHYLADRFRGPVWEEVILQLPRAVRLVCLSATVSNADEFGAWLREVRGEVEVVTSEVRPVPLWEHVAIGHDLLDLFVDEDGDPAAAQGPGSAVPHAVNPDLVTIARAASSQGMNRERHDRPGNRNRGHGRGRHGRSGRRDDHANRQGSARGPHSDPYRRLSRPELVRILDSAALLPAIVFIFSRAGCDGAVGQCARARVDLTTAAEKRRITRLVDEHLAGVPEDDAIALGLDRFRASAVHGVAAHHAGLLPLVKEIVEELFVEGLVKVVFATETLALGINMPARSVVLERLVKFDGTAHVDLTPGEFTQLTGRAGRRGIDTEGHAVTVARPGFDPEAVAHLASARSYPLRSAFAPTYNMATNLLARRSRADAREVLETSFAQFQADRGVVGLAREARDLTSTIDAYREAAHCERGDIEQYLALRDAIGNREAELSRERADRQRRRTRETLAGLGRGDVVALPGGRRGGYVTVISVDSEQLDGVRLSVLAENGRVRALPEREVSAPPAVVGHLDIPRHATFATARERKDTAARMRAVLTGEDASTLVRRTAKNPSTAASDTELARLKAELRHHPCHDCPDLDQHLRWARRAQRSSDRHQKLMRRITGRTSSIGRSFDRLCELLEELGYLRTAGADDVELTDAGQILRGIYAERDLLVAECVRRGVWADLDAPGLAAVVSACVHEHRRDDPELPALPSSPRIQEAFDATVQTWRDLRGAERRRGIEPVAPPDGALSLITYRWARGASLTTALGDRELPAGDFVRLMRRVIDLLDQLPDLASAPTLADTARDAARSLRRGIVAQELERA